MGFFDRFKKKVLIIDDDKDTLYFIGKILSRAKYSVSAIAQGKGAVDFALTVHPDVIVLDSILPDVSGAEVERLIRMDPSLAKVPIVHMSGVLTLADEKAAHKNKSHRYLLAKPVTADRLLATIKTALSS